MSHQQQWLANGQDLKILKTWNESLTSNGGWKLRRQQHCNALPELGAASLAKAAPQWKCQKECVKVKVCLSKKITYAPDHRLLPFHPQYFRRRVHFSTCPLGPNSIQQHTLALLTISASTRCLGLRWLEMVFENVHYLTLFLTGLQLYFFSQVCNCISPR